VIATSLDWNTNAAAALAGAGILAGFLWLCDDFLAATIDNEATTMKKTAKMLALSTLAMLGSIVNSENIWAQGRNDVIAQSGQTIPGGNGTYSTFQTALLNNSGQVAFFSILSEPLAALWITKVFIWAREAPRLKSLAPGRSLRVETAPCPNSPRFLSARESA
jgi:hypothetical protein